MPRTSMLESLLSAAAAPRGSSASDPAPPHPGTALAAGANRLVEAPTTEEALAEVGTLLGPDARIVDARRVRRGGVGGFFAKEIVQLHVAPSATPLVDTPRPAASPVDRLLDDADDVPDDVDFATFLRSQLGADTSHASSRDMVGTPTTPTPSAGSSDPVSATYAPWTPPPVTAAPPAPAADGWSRDALLNLGVPAGLVATLAPATPRDDLAWTTALTEALRTSCRPLPSGPCVLVGPRAEDLTAGGEVRDATVARSRSWLAALRRDRWVHLVVGGEGWREALAWEPMAVSWTRPEDLPDALRCAHELGMVLGFGPSAAGPRRARPFDVALALRALVVGR